MYNFGAESRGLASPTGGRAHLSVAAEGDGGAFLKATSEAYCGLGAMLSCLARSESRGMSRWSTAF
jgi:hypothetical protein